MKRIGIPLLGLLLGMTLLSISDADENNTPYPPPNNPYNSNNPNGYSSEPPNYNQNNVSNSQQQMAIKQATKTALSALNQCQLKNDGTAQKFSFFNGG